MVHESHALGKTLSPSCYILFSKKCVLPKSLSAFVQEGFGTCCGKNCFWGDTACPFVPDLTVRYHLSPLEFLQCSCTALL